MGRKVRTRAREAAGAAGRVRRYAGHQPARRSRRRSRRGRRGGVERERDRRRALRGFGPRWASTIYGTRAQYKVLLELDPKDQEQCESLKIDRLQDADRRAGAVRVGGSPSRTTVGPQTVESRGTAAGRDDFVRPASRGVARNGRRSHSAGAAGVLPATVTTKFRDQRRRSRPRCRTSACSSSSPSESSTSCSGCSTKARCTR